MIYSGKILNTDGRAVPGAYLQFKTDAGAVITTIPANQFGAWSIDTAFDDGLFNPGITIVFSAPGFTYYSISADLIPQTFDVTIAKRVSNSQILLIGAAVGAGLLFLSKGKKKRVSGAETAETRGKPGLQPWVMPTLILGGGAYLLYHFFGKPDPRIQQGKALADAAGAELNLGLSGVPTLSPAQVETLASSIEQAANDCGTDEDAIYRAFDALGNRADLLLLIKTYAVRVYHACFDGDWFSDTPRNLAETLTSELSSSAMGEVQNILQSKGINFSF